MGKKSKKIKYLPIQDNNEPRNRRERNEMDNLQNTPNSNEKITSLNRPSEDFNEKPQNEKKELNKSLNEMDNLQNTSNSNEKITSLNQPSEDFNEKPQNEKKELNKSMNKEFGEISNSDKKNFNLSCKNEQTYKQNQNQVKDNTKVKVSKKTEDNYSLDQQSKNSKKKSQKTTQDNNTLKGAPLLIDKQKQETAKSQSTNKNAHVKQNYGDHKQNQSRKQNEMCKIDGEECFLNEIDEDLFGLSDKFALAHCVAEDLRMGAGIAIEFKHRFGGVGKLVDQKLKVGDVGIVERHNQIAFYLITKRISSGKPTMNTLEKALNSLLAKMKEMKLTKLGIPTIGCGLDGLDWSDVKSLIYHIFSGSGIEISVCIPSKLLDRKASRPLNVYISRTNLWEMQAKTDIVIFIDMEQVHKNNWTDDVVDKVNAKYPFKENLLKDVKNKELKTGSIKQYTVHNENIICAFINPCEHYSSIESAFVQIYRSIRQLNGYLAIQSGSIKPDNNFKHIGWIVLILRSIMKTFNHCELWLCGGDDDSLYDEYCRNKWNSFSYSNTYNSKQMSHRHNKNSDDSHSNHQPLAFSWNN